jgi:cytoskeletal protein CcmA (bactofilin family)
LGQNRAFSEGPVSPYIAVAVLVLVLGLMFMLPLIPALVELRRKSDALPLSVVQQNAGEIRYFANSFRSYIKGLEPIMQRCLASGATETGTLPDGENYVVLGRADEPLVRAIKEQNAIHPVVIAAGIDLVVPPEATFSRDIYARGQFEGGKKNNYRAILGERDVHLGEASRVQRWVHAVGEFTADLGCRLYGRISSDLLIRLRADCSFLRMNAPCIEIGHPASTAEAAPRSSIIPANPGSRSSPRFLHDGDFEVLAGQVISGNIVIRGKLHIHSGARICGSVKSVKDMVIEHGVSVEGSLITAGKMRIGPHCSIHGPVIAERELAIAIGTRCGTPEYPTTVSALQIEVEEGVVVFGTLWARQRGRVVVAV